MIRESKFNIEDIVWTIGIVNYKPKAIKKKVVSIDFGEIRRNAELNIEYTLEDLVDPSAENNIEKYEYLIFKTKEELQNSL